MGMTLPTPGAGDDGKVLEYDHAGGQFVFATAASTAGDVTFDDANFDRFLDGLDEETDDLQDALDMIDQQAVEVVESGTEPTTTYPGLVWLDTSTSGGGLDDPDAIHDNETEEIHAVTEKATPVAADEVLIEDSAASYAKKRVQVGNLPLVDNIGIEKDSGVLELKNNLLMYAYRQPSGTAGGSSVAGSWQTIPLNVELYDPNGWGSLASNQITLVAGTYEVEWIGTTYRSSEAQFRLRNITNSATLAVAPA